jgi:N-acetylmuramoyl-L-alanine amidase
MAPQNKKTYLVALDDGHGMDTPGKRTPMFPDRPGVGLEGERGNYMHENEFNRAVVNKVKTHLERCGINVLLTAPTDEDTPLKARTDLANKMNADILVSVHANAATGSWGNAKGIETYYYPGSASGKALATALHNQLIKNTKQVNRGIKEGNLHMLRETKMPAALVECGFMDNLEEAALLLSDEFRNECALEIAMGICDYLKVPFVDVKDAIHEEEITLKLEHDWQWEMLASVLEGMVSKKLLNDQTWVEKARQKKLTVSELAWLNTILMARNHGISA